MEELFLKIIDLGMQINEMQDRLNKDLEEIDHLKNGLEQFKVDIVSRMKEKDVHNFSVTDQQGNRFMFYQQSGHLKYMKVR